MADTLKDLLTDDQLEKMNWDDLIYLRNMFKGDIDKQRLIAPFEHQAWARERVGENKMLAPLYSIMPAGYYAAKKLGIVGEPESGMQTEADLRQVGRGMLGAWEGLMK